MKKNQIPMPNLKIKMTSLDKDGNQVDGFPLRDSHSWVRNGYNFMVEMFCFAPLGAATYGAGFLACKDTSGVTGTDQYGHYWAARSKIEGVIGDATYGIVVGIDDTAETGEEHVLGAKIQHGSGSVQLEYQAPTTTVDSYDAPTLTWSATFERDFNNNSGASIGVNEAGIIGRFVLGLSGVDYYLIARDVVDSTVIVPHGGQLVVEYVLQITYPE